MTAKYNYNRGVLCNFFYHTGRITFINDHNTINHFCQEVQINFEALCTNGVVFWFSSCILLIGHDINSNDFPYYLKAQNLKLN